MVRKRKPRGIDFKAKVALAALRERKTVGKLAKDFDVHCTQIHQWKKLLQEQASAVFESGRKRRPEGDAAAESKELYEQIGRLKMELEWLNKKVEPFTDVTLASMLITKEGTTAEAGNEPPVPGPSSNCLMTVG